MEITVLTLFPEIFSVLDYGVIGRGKEKGLYNLNTINPRDFTKDSYKTVDDYPFGGGIGMVMKPEPIFKAYESYISSNEKPFVISMDPKGVIVDDDIITDLSEINSLMIICGRYEGIDGRVDSIVDIKLSIGNFVLSGGEIPALVLIDAVVRKIPGVLGKKESYQDDSYSMGMLDNSYYTRPSVFKGMKVPEVLLSGNHKKIWEYRLKERILRTLMDSPNLLKKYDFSRDEIKILKNISEELNSIIGREAYNA
jgi:tRNA (guanine37-N1)-methyltransferase